MIVGPTVALELAPNLSVRSGLFVSRRGGAYRDELSYPDGPLAEVREATYRIDYLEVPLCLRHRFRERQRWHPVLIGGVTWRRPVSSELTWDTTRISGWAESSEVAAVLGAGVEVPFGPWEGSVEIHASRTLSGLDEADGFTYGANVEAIDVLLGLHF